MVLKNDAIEKFLENGNPWYRDLDCIKHLTPTVLLGLPDIKLFLAKKKKLPFHGYKED